MIWLECPFLEHWKHYWPYPSRSLELNKPMLHYHLNSATDHNYLVSHWGSYREVLTATYKRHSRGRKPTIMRLLPIVSKNKTGMYSTFLSTTIQYNTLDKLISYLFPSPFLILHDLPAIPSQTLKQDKKNNFGISNASRMSRMKLLTILEYQNSWRGEE